MISVNPYLNFNGNTEEAFNFYRSVFGGEFIVLQRFKDTPEKDSVATNDQDKIMHIALPIGEANILMATDALESAGQSLTTGNNMHLSISTDSNEETKRIFNALSAGGRVTVPLDKTFWGSYFGMCTDKYDIQWMVSNDEKG